MIYFFNVQAVMPSRYTQAENQHDSQNARGGSQNEEGGHLGQWIQMPVINVSAGEPKQRDADLKNQPGHDLFQQMAGGPNGIKRCER